MAQIFLFGQVENDLEVKKSQKNSSYVCFYVKEQASGRSQSYQVWAWNTDVSRLIQLGVKKGSQIWITGTLQMVDATDSQGIIRTKILKVYLTNWGYISLRFPTHSHVDSKNEPLIPEAVSTSPAEILDGDRDFLPE